MQATHKSLQNQLERSTHPKHDTTSGLVYHLPLVNWLTNWLRKKWMNPMKHSYLTSAVLIAASFATSNVYAETWKFALEEVKGSVQDAYAQEFKAHRKCNRWRRHSGSLSIRHIRSVRRSYRAYCERYYPIYQRLARYFWFIRARNAGFLHPLPFVARQWCE